MEVSAHIPVVRASPKKATRIAQLIRGKKVSEARNILLFLPHKLARVLYNLLQSAIANAENNFDLAREDLIVRRVDVGRVYFLRRVKARARGRGTLNKRPTCFLRVVVEAEKGPDKEEK